MRTNLGPSVSLDFLDGYLFRLLQEIANEQGLERSGFANYYGYRLAQKIGGLIEYEENLARYLLEGYPGRRVLHAGMGIGTLACALACNGMTVAGVESYAPRVTSARRLRAALIEIWPEIEARYEIIEGDYPQVLTQPPAPAPASVPMPAPVPWVFRFLPWQRRPERSGPTGASPAASWPSGPWLDSNAILVFTNVASEWNDSTFASILESLPRFAEVLLDLRLFGTSREEEHDRIALFDRIAAGARSAERLPELASGSHFARFVFATP